MIHPVSPLKRLELFCLPGEWRPLKAWQLIFSPDGSKVAYVAEHADKQFVVVNDEEGPKFDSVDEPVFSPDSKRLAYGAQEGRRFWWKVMQAK
jgi:hypothetical protein